MLNLLSLLLLKPKIICKAAGSRVWRKKCWFGIPALQQQWLLLKAPHSVFCFSRIWIQQGQRREQTERCWPFSFAPCVCTVGLCKFWGCSSSPKKAVCTSLFPWNGLTLTPPELFSGLPLPFSAPSQGSGSVLDVQLLFHQPVGDRSCCSIRSSALPRAPLCFQRKRLWREDVSRSNSKLQVSGWAAPAGRQGPGSPGLQMALWTLHCFNWSLSIVEKPVNTSLHLKHFYNIHFPVNNSLKWLAKS